MIPDLPFRFDVATHTYTLLDSGETIPHVTGMLQEAGISPDPRWYTQASRERGSAVHRMTAEYDHGALVDVIGAWARYKGWLQAHVKAMGLIPHAWHHIELPYVHGYYRYGGRPDRVGLIYNAIGLLEVKSGGYEAAHPIQTALQAILVAPSVNLPPELIRRYALYLRENGRFSLEEHTRRADFTDAQRVIHETCSIAA